jgi:hypothetical protein
MNSISLAETAGSVARVEAGSNCVGCPGAPGWTTTGWSFALLCAETDIANKHVKAPPQKYAMTGLNLDLVPDRNDCMITKDKTLHRKIRNAENSPAGGDNLSGAQPYAKIPYPSINKDTKTKKEGIMLIRKTGPWLVLAAMMLVMQGCNFSFSSGGTEKISESDAEKIATKTLQTFNRALQKGDFEEFHQSEVADSAKNELTTEKFNQAFSGFIKNHVDIRPKEGSKMVFSPKPEIDGKFLNLNGSYPAETGQKVTFKLQYVKDTGDWDLKYIDVKLS